MLSLRTCLLLSLVAACGPKPPQTETTDGDTSTGDGGPGSTTSPTTSASTTAVDPTTGAPGSTGPDSSGGGFMLPPDEGVSFITPTDGGGSGCGCGGPVAAGPGLRCKECDPWAQDCPEGEKCTPCDGSGSGEWNAQECIPLPADPDHAGEPCTVEGHVASGHDSCDLTSICWYIDPDTLTGTCVPRCTGTPDNGVCAEGTTCSVSNDGVLNLCLPTCDPLGDDCPAGRLCAYTPFTDPYGFVCIVDLSGAEGQPFDPCESEHDCDPGLVCLLPEAAIECDPNAAGCCLPFCDTTLPAQCPGAMQQCLSWFPDEPAPPGLEDVGVCALPP